MKYEILIACYFLFMIAGIFMFALGVGPVKIIGLAAMSLSIAMAFFFCRDNKL